MPLRDFKDLDATSPSHQTPLFYQTYHETSDTQHRLRELKFFANIVAFAICCVISAFVLLAFEWTPPLAFSLAIPLAFLSHQGLKLCYRLLKARYDRKALNR